MTRIISTLAFFAFGILSLTAQDNLTYTSTDIEIAVDDGHLGATYLQPKSINNGIAILMIVGSGPTDRDGNNPVMKNNSLKMLAEGLAAQNIATLRYDKRGIAESTNAAKKGDSLRFEHLIEDAFTALQTLQNLGHDTIYIAGHSQGSLIGMGIAQKEPIGAHFPAAGFISIAGPSEPVNEALIKQMEAQPAFVRDTVQAIINELLAGRKVEKIDPMLQSLFRPSIQPFLMSYFKYDPCVEIAKLTTPTLIIQGSTDIQVFEEDAKKLNEAAPNSTLILFEGMNHILKHAEIDRTKNIATYSRPDLPIVPELIPAIVTFLHQE